MAMCRATQEEIKNLLVNRSSPDTNEEQWLRGQYYAYQALLDIDFEEVQVEQ